MNCGEAHWSSKCKAIGRPPEGFSKENGGGGHDHGDDEDEKAAIVDITCVDKGKRLAPCPQRGCTGKTMPSSKDVKIL
jgi:hypothetical protein